MQITEQSKDFSISPQLNIDDMAEIMTMGFKTIINHRPDGEGGSEQPLNKVLEAQAIQLGLTYIYIPVIPNNIQPENQAAFALAYESSPKPILGFCRTGKRAGKMHQLYLSKKA